MNDVEVILVGDELLKGERQDAHLAFLGRGLARAGARIATAHAVGDDAEAIAELMRGRLAGTRVLILTGGLGPTDDDVTRIGVAAATGRELEFDTSVWDRIVAFFASRGRTPSDNNRRQAQFPSGAAVLTNDNGTAPGFRLDHDGTTIFVLPGPPLELQPICERDVFPALREIFGREPLRVETFRTIGIGESQLVALMASALDAVGSFAVSFLPSLVGVDLVLTERSGLADRERLHAEADTFAHALEGAIGTKFYERGQRHLAAVIGDVLAERGATVCLAESLTGGLMGKMLTDTPGSSAYFLAGVVSYSDESKRELLGVREETLSQFGAVSEETCTEMAHGARNRSGATYALATTGVAGPTGGSAKKPVGLVYIGLAFEGGSQVKRVMYPGSRVIIRERAAHGALWLLFDHLRGH